MISILIITKGNNSVNIARGVTICVFAYCQSMIYVFTKFRKIILGALRVMERARF